MVDMRTGPLVSAGASDMLRLLVYNPLHNDSRLNPAVIHAAVACESVSITSVKTGFWLVHKYMTVPTTSTQLTCYVRGLRC
ncbi:hypothetical protein PHET_02656 [Paragonimus heterotremus]|uniref:Uncharacterized protein n=1 Tax=Paragonimus heterotremus TaxID=100268 RepID=A0A8J4SRR0_9TREM|nr:hypothetical protein PHET_02656 [Paragonimus heterotremus]